jgi:DNA-binding MarR family transcriptional regulator
MDVDGVIRLRRVILGLARRLDAARLGRVTGKLETFGLVRRAFAPGNDCRVRVEGTPAGEATWRLTGAEQAELIGELLAGLSAREQRTLAAARPALDQLSDSLRHPLRRPLSAGGLVT